MQLKVVVSFTHILLPFLLGIPKVQSKQPNIIVIVADDLVSKMDFNSFF